MPFSFSQFDEVFTPGAPMRTKTFFFGREQEFNDLSRSLKRPGIHPIVVGNRGVGKTTLVDLALQKLSDTVVSVTCNSKMDFYEFGSSLLTQLGISLPATETTEENSKAGGAKGNFGMASLDSTGQRKTIVKRSAPAGRSLSAWAVYEALRDYGKRVIVVVDEYESIGNKHDDFHDGVASLIKTLADNSRRCDTRVIVIGVAASAEALLGKHESIERNAREIYLRTLRMEDVKDFLDAAEEHLGFQFKNQVKEAIVKNSLGYPYYVHLVALECLDVMQERDKRSRAVTDDDYRKAVNKAVAQAFRSELRKYKAAIYEASDAEKLLIRELALLQGDGPLNVHSLRQRLSTHETLRGNAFDAVLNTLLLKKRVLYISRGTQEVRFADPLMAPFLKSLATRGSDLA
jgi:Cdc6-like AAA superfamily ATPase